VAVPVATANATVLLNRGVAVRFLREALAGSSRARRGERQADGESDDDEEPGEQHGGRSGLEARQELSATGAQDAPM